MTEPAEQGEDNKVVKDQKKSKESKLISTKDIADSKIKDKDSNHVKVSASYRDPKTVSKKGVVKS